jgi:hypothetical protein
VLHGADSAADFSKTKILNADGTEPLTVHHWTYDNFDTFDRNKILERFPDRDPEGVDRVGHWFTTNPDARYANPDMGGKRYDAQLNIERPLYFDDEGGAAGEVAWQQLERAVKEAGGATKYREQLKLQGYDGIVLQSTKLDGFDQTAILALEPDQVKIVGRDGAAAEPAKLDLGEQVDPAIADRQRQEVELKAASPLQATADQKGEIGLGLFDHSDQLAIELHEEAKSLLDELEGDDKAIAALKGCL